MQNINIQMTKHTTVQGRTSLGVNFTPPEQYKFRSYVNESSTRLSHCSSNDIMALSKAAILLCCILSVYAAVVFGKPYDTKNYGFFLIQDVSGPASFGKDVPFKKCGGYAVIDSMDISPCDTEPCDFHTGSTVNTSVYFTPTKRISGGKLGIYAVIGPIRISMPPENPDICEGHNLECPLKEGVKQEFILSEKVKKPPFPGTFTVQAEITDQDNQVASCVEFKARISN